MSEQETNTSQQTEEAKRTIIANFDNKVDVRETKFHFKKVKDKETGVESKRPTIELLVPTPSVEGIIAIIETGGKGLELLQEAVLDVVVNRARELINENENLTAETFDVNALRWETIANLPKAERRGGGIAKEVWEEFAEDYIAVMPGVTGKTVEQVTNAAKIYLNKFNQVKSNKKVIAKLKEQLALYASNAPAAETYADCIEFLVNKADALLNVSDEDLLANL